MSNTKNTPAEKKKKKKQPGLVRWKGFVPLLILGGGLVFYYLVLFDPHLKWLLESLGSRLNGARVDITYLRTSIWNCDFEMKKIEFGNPSVAMKNRFEVGRVHFKFLFGPLLKKKFVIENASVEDITYGTDRTRSGLLPESYGPTGLQIGTELLDKFFPGAYDNLRAQFQTNPLKNMGTLFSSFDIDQELKKIEADFKSVKLAEDVQAQIDRATKDLNAQVKGLPGKKEADQIKGRIGAVGMRKLKNPQDFVNAVNEVNSIKKEVNTQANKVDTLQKTASQESSTLTSKVKSIDKTIDQDIASVQSKLKLPNFDFKDLSRNVFGPTILGHIERVSYWVAYARAKMPKKTNPEDPGMVVQERANGADVLFGRKENYPSFLMKKASIDSNVSKDDSKGFVRGTLEGVTSNPPIYGKPTVLRLDGAFPASRIADAKLQVTVDHTTEDAKENILASVGGFPLEEFSITSTPDLNLAINKARASATFNADFTEKALKSTTKFRASQVKYEAGSKHRMVDEALKNVVNSLNTFSMTAGVSGPYDSLKLTAESDLGRKLAAAFKTEFRSQINALQGDVRKKVMDKVGDKKKVAEQKLASLKTKVIQPIEEKKRQFDQLKAKADSEIKRIQNEQKRAAQQKVQKATQQQLQNIKKKIKIPGF